MKASAITRIIIFSFVIILLATILSAGIILGGPSGVVLSDDYISSGNIQSSGSVTASEIKTLEIHWVSGSVTIRAADTDQITFSENGSSDETNTMLWKQSGDKLTLQFCKPKTVLGISLGLNSNASKDLVITVPQDWVCTQLDITSVSSEIDIDGIAADSIDLESVSGRSSITGTLGKISIDTVSGDCILTLPAGAESIELDSVSADLTIYWPENHGYTTEIDGVSGDVHSDFSTPVHGDGACSIEADGVSGDIKIKKLN